MSKSMTFTQRRFSSLPVDSAVFPLLKKWMYLLSVPIEELYMPPSVSVAAGDLTSDLTSAILEDIAKGKKDW